MTCNSKKWLLSLKDKGKISVKESRKSYLFSKEAIKEHMAIEEHNYFQNDNQIGRIQV